MPDTQPPAQQPPPATPTTRRTRVRASLEIGRETADGGGAPNTSASTGGKARQTNLDWVDSLSLERLLVECHKRDIELPRNGGNYVTRRARLRKYVQEHGRRLPTKPKAVTPPEPTQEVEMPEATVPPAVTSEQHPVVLTITQEDTAQPIPPPTAGEPVMTQPTNTTSRPDAGQKKDKKKKDKKARAFTPPPPAAIPPSNRSYGGAPFVRGLISGVIAIAFFVAFATLAFLLMDDNEDNGGDVKSAPTVSAASGTTTPALTADKVTKLATEAAEKAIKDAKVLNADQAKQLVSDAVNQTMAAFKASPSMTENEISRFASDYVTKNAQQAGGSPGGSWTPAQKCEWLRNHFPQTTQSVQALGAKLANVQTQRIRTHLYPCDAVNTVFDGFVVLGPNEGYTGSFTLDVPSNGAIDAYPGATFTGRTKQIGSETVRAFDGKVTAVSATYWPWLDENPPIGAAKTIDQQPPADNVCILGKDLAIKNGWNLEPNQPDDVTKYGGAQVTLDKVGTLPKGWEALASGRKIASADTDRTMVITTWSIYPPPGDCRDKLGVAK